MRAQGWKFGVLDAEGAANIPRAILAVDSTCAREPQRTSDNWS